MPHIRGYLKRKEEKERIWKEVFQELNKPEEDTRRQGHNFGGQGIKLPGTPNTKPQIEKLPFVPEESGQSVPLDYAKHAASGWARFKADTDRQRILLWDPSYQKWQKAMGAAVQDDADQYPKSNWSFAQNNRFGYLYSHNPEEAKQFAKLVNAEYSNTPTMISDAAAMEEETVAEDMGLLEDVKNSGGLWGYIGRAIQKTVDLEAENSKNALEKGLEDAQIIQDLLGSAADLEAANADVGKQVGDNVADGIIDVIANAANTGGKLAEAQTNAGKTTVDTVVKTVPEVLQSFVPPSIEPPKTNDPIDIPLPEIGLVGAEPKKDPILLTPMEAMMGKAGDYEEKDALGYQQWKGDRNHRLNIENSEGYQAYLDFIAKNNYAGTPEGMAAAQKLLGPGYTIEEPQPNWSAAENNRFGYLYYTDPAAAAEYARTVNARYAGEEEQKTREWVKDHQGLAMAGAWITDRLGLAETLDSELYYAQYGQLPYTSRVTPGRFSEIVPETIGEELFGDNQGDKAIYNALYSAKDAAFNAYLAKLYGGVFGVAVGAVDSFGDAYNQALRDAMLWGLSDEEAVAYARKMALSNGVGSVASGMLAGKMSEANSMEDAMVKEAVSNSAGSAVANGLSATVRYDALVDYHIKCGMTQEEAEYVAKHQVLHEFGEGVFNDLLGGLAFGLGYGINR